MARYQATLTDENTGEILAVVRRNDKFLLEQAVQQKKEVLERKHHQQIKRKQKDDTARKIEEQARDAAKATETALSDIEQYRNLLKATLSVNDIVDWESLKDRNKFKEFLAPPKPIREDFMKKVRKPSFLDVIPPLKRARIEAEEKAKNDFAKALEDQQSEERRLRNEYEQSKTQFTTDQASFNTSVDNLKNRYESEDKEGIKDYISLVLERSAYPVSLNLSSEVSYDGNSKILLVDMSLPNTRGLPKTVGCKFIKATVEMKEVLMKDKEFEEFYNNAIYQISLRTVHEVFEADYKEFKNCLVSLQVERGEFSGINLANIDPVECFRHLKGVTAGSLVNLNPVKPIMQLNQVDKRIIQAANVLEGLNEEQNLASMDWQEFEVLVRDLIRKMFSGDGCRVEVTRASRDAGVDAIVFDEDPIKGGKYVVQAKRYNNIVSVSAVRDLYGTMLNEGAVKGILVTTSYYGKDSIEFAKDKPIKLINGEELIYLFNKYGYKVKIKLQQKQKAAAYKPY